MRATIVFGLVLGLGACGGASDAPRQPVAGPEVTGREDAESVAAAAPEHEQDSPDPSPPTREPVDVPLLEQELAYGEADGANLTGFLAMPRDAIEPPPGLLVVHEWWGLNDDIRAMTRRLAAEGYIALAVDLYGDEVTDDPARAEALMSAVTASPEAVRSNLRQAHEYLSRYALSPRTGVIGWGLGGGWALQTALMLPEELDAAVMYYGRLERETSRLERLSTPLLGSFGAQDESIPAADVRRFRSRLMQLGKNVDIYVYPDVGHAFANPSARNYDADAAAHARRRTLEFLERHLGGGA